jgi:hypothetical protein
LYITDFTFVADLMKILRDVKELFDMFVEAVKDGYEPPVQEMYTFTRIVCKFDK